MLFTPLPLFHDVWFFFLGIYYIFLPLACALACTGDFYESQACSGTSNGADNRVCTGSLLCFLLYLLAEPEPRGTNNATPIGLLVSTDGPEFPMPEIAVGSHAARPIAKKGAKIGKRN